MLYICSFMMYAIASDTNGRQRLKRKQDPGKDPFFMAQKRLISVNFWKDNYIADLDLPEKALFNYLLTNPATNVAGIYEINLREVAFDTKADLDFVQKAIDKFQRDGKVQYYKGWLLIRNWIKNQSMNPSMV